MATKLKQYNGAIFLLGGQKLASLSEETKERRALDEVYDESVAYMLSKGLWNFAIRTSEISPDTDTDPLFGYDNTFNQPSDLVRIVNISDTGYFDFSFQNYAVEGSNWFSDADYIYLRYISDDSSYGGDLSLWTEAFAIAHQAYLAFKSGLPITGDKGTRADMWNYHKRLLAEAKTLDAVEQKISFKPEGNWVRSRFRRVNNKNRTA